MSLPKPEADRIADRAVTLWERLRHLRNGHSSGGRASRQTELRLGRWRHVVAKGDPLAFERRLAWDGLTLRDARAALACADASPALPQWREVFDDLIRCVEHYCIHLPETISRDPNHPRPFEDVLFPLVYAARCRLRQKTETRRAGASGRPPDPLSDQAIRGLEIGLLDRLCQVCAPSLQSEFSRYRPAGYGLLNALVGATGAKTTRHYREFVCRLLSANLMPMFEQYPVLARLVAVMVENWVAYCAEFQSHLMQDLPLLEKCFQASSHGSLGELVQLRFALSDTHRQGRSVIGLTFSCGLKLAYKPKPLGIDRAFNQLVHWCNQQGLALDLRTVRILDRPSYGWMEWVDQLPCADGENARAFFRRAGMLLALLHILRCTDCHYENMIASGGYPVLIDGETAVAPDLDSMENALRATSNDWFWQSVVRTGMLPFWETRYESSVSCDLSALGGIGAQATPTEVPQWKSINTDDMDVHLASVMLPSRGNAAMLNGVILSPCDYVEDLVGGFEEMYRLLLRRRKDLLAADGPLPALRTHPVRYVFRPTEQYGQILRQSLAPAHVQNGCDRSIELDHLSRGLLAAPECAKALVLLGAERQALEGLDIPRFDVQADETALRYGDRVIAPHFFDASGYSKVVDRLESLNEADLSLQSRIIKASFQGWAARAERHVDPGMGGCEPSSGLTVRPGEFELSRRFHVVANTTAEAIASSAICSSDGSIGWLGLAHLPRIGRYQLLPVENGLYGGRSGIALFLAACDHVNRSDAYRSLVCGALQNLRQSLRASDPSWIERHLRASGIGMAEGAGGIVYALTCISGWWQDLTLLDDAEILARSISPEVLKADRLLDVIGGTAGAVLGLMKLYRARPSPDILTLAQSCADWLCRNQRSDGEYAGAWDTLPASRPLTGFAHGASGIASALTQVYAITREPKLLAAVRAAIEFEHTAFLPDAGNWIDFRRQEPGMLPSCATSWCHGAPGIGMARLALLAEIQHPLLVPDLETALATTQVPTSQSVDNICCGSFGRIDILSYAAKTLGRKELSFAATAQAWEVLSRPNPFRISPCDGPEARNPGFFDGLAGIGYALLRLVAPGDLPCVLAWE